jgi:hypothetical protein
MKKSTLFISATLTTFMLAVVFGVASAYQKVVQAAGATDVAMQAQSTDASIPTVTSTKDGGMTIEQAANLASKVIGNSTVYSAEVTQLNGINSYLVTFSSGDLVYVSLDGKIMSISKLPVNYIVNQTTSLNGGNGGGNNGGNVSNSNGNGNSNDNSNYNNNNGNSNYHENDDEHGNENDHGTENEHEHEGGDD